MLNSLYGKFATNPNVQGSFPYLNEDGIVNYDLLEKEERDPVYLPVASFITAWARWITITSAQKNYERFIYADTDSLHLLGTEPPVGIELDPNELGKWDHEFTFSKAKYLRQKAYIQTGKKTGSDEEFTKVTMAGMPSSIHEFVDYKNFHEGTTFTIDNEVKENAIVIPMEKAKLRPKRVKGGVILEPTYFTIRK